MAPRPLNQPLFNVSKNLALRDCNEGILAFDEMNGKTILLNTQAGRILRALILMRDVPELVLRSVSGMDADSNASEFQDLIAALQDSELINS